MRIVVVTNYAVVAYDIITDMTKSEVAEALAADESVLFDLKTGGTVLINSANVVSLEIKDTPLSK